MPKPRAAMRRLLHQAQQAPASLWPDVQAACAWRQEAAEMLENRAQETGEALRSRYQALLTRMSAQTEAAGALQGAIQHVLKVTQSYWPGLLHGYDVAGLPRTNHDLEHFFGAVRHRERRCSGRKRASATRVVRGAVRVLAATAPCPLTPEPLAPRDLAAWRAPHPHLQQRQYARVLQHRFRRQPEAYLAALEDRLIKLSLPP